MPRGTDAPDDAPDAYVPPEPPGRLASAYDRCRYEARLLRYALTFVSRPSPTESVGLGATVLGSGSVVTAVYRFTADQPTWVRVGLAAAVALAVLACAFLFLARISRVLSTASRKRADVEALHDDMRAGLADDSAFRALEAVYLPHVSEINRDAAFGDSGRALRVLGADDGACAALTLLLPARPGETLGDLLEAEWTPRPRSWSVWASRFAQPRRAFMSALRAANGDTRPGVDDESGDNLVLDGLTVDPATGHVRLRVSIGSYGQIMRTSDSLINEFAVFAHLIRDRTDDLRRLGRLLARIPLLRYGRAVRLSPAGTLRALPWRNEIHGRSGSLPDLLLRPTGRAAGLGVAVALVRAEEGVRTAYVGRRSSQVGTYAGVRHVMPAGMCNAKDDIGATRQPIRADFLRWTMLGELLEECYDEKELAVYRTEDWVKHIARQCAVRDLPTEAPTFTGIAFDLLNLRPEVCAVVDVVDRGQRSFSEEFRLCWEYDPRVGITRVPLSGMPAGCGDLSDWVQSGLGSLALAHAHYARMAGAGTG